jgi:cytochrome c-type biogenesis protein CcmH/NrfG
MNSGKMQESINLLNNQLKKNPKNPQAYYMRAVANVRMRKYDQAAADYKQVLQLSPSGPMSELAKKGLAKIHM